MKNTIITILLWASAGFAQQGSNCDTSLASPAPDGLVCEVKGRALVSKPGIRQYPASSFTICRDLCLNDILCQSFNYQQTTRRCRVLGTQTKTQQVKPRSASKLTFSNRACYDRAGICSILNPGFSDLTDNGGGLARPTEGTFGQQIAQIRPWDVFYGPTDTESTVTLGNDNGDAFARMTIVGSESLGLYQKVLFEDDPVDPDAIMVFSFETYGGNIDVNIAYTVTITYRNTVLKSFQMKPSATFWTIDDDPQQRQYSATTASGFRTEFLNALQADPDRSKERVFGVLIQGPGSGADEGVISIRSLSLA